MADKKSTPTLAERLRTVQVGVRADLEVSRHSFRGEPTYVVRNSITFQSHSLSKADYQILVALGSEKPLGDVFDEVVKTGLLGQKQEDEFYAFILNLHQFGFLNLPVTDGKALYDRFRKRQISQHRAKITGFLFWRVPLIDPDAMLDRTVRYVAPLFSRGAFVLWLTLMMFCSGIIWQRWEDFKEPLQTILATKNIAGLLILLVVLKVIHEFGHAYMCKVFGGKVPEMGAYFVCFTPCAYVDASASWGFASKKQRIAVSLAGMYVETMVAGIALLIWNATDPSPLNSFAHQTVMLASIVTIGFNVNPLMRYDGYYVLSDFVEIPNLREQSIVQVQAVCKRWLLGIRSDRLPFSSWRRGLLFIYGVFSSIWKVFLVIAICAGIALKIHILGAIMATVYGCMVLWGVVSKFIKYLWMSPETAAVRGRAVALGIVVLTGVPLGIAAIPARMPRKVYGVVAAMKETPVYAQASGFLRRSEVTPGQQVRANSVLYDLENARTQATVEVAHAELNMISLQAESEFENNLATATMTLQRANHAQRVLSQAKRKVRNLLIIAPLAGKAVDCAAIERTGYFVREGEHVATITSGGWTVRSLLTAQDLADTKPHVGQKVRVRLLGLASEELSGTITNVAMTGSNVIPSPSLTQLGGGEIAVAPGTMTARKPYFEVIIELQDPGCGKIQRGATALVSLNTKSQTIGVRLYRSVLRFLNKLRT